MSNNPIDRASDIEFSQAIADAIPQPAKREGHTFLAMGAAYVLGKAIKRGSSNK